MSRINFDNIRPGDNVTFYGATGRSTRRRVEAVGASGIFVWYQGGAFRVPAPAITSVELLGRVRDTGDRDD